jgi:hypothetical protein
MLANDGLLVSPSGTGVNVATHLISSKEYQVVIPADDSGHLAQSVPSYTFYIKNQSGAAGKIHFDIFNAAGSGRILEIRGLWITPALNVGVTGAVSPDFDFFRTSAVGTSGTTVGYNGAAFPTIIPMDSTNPSIPAQITMRAAPTGGATSARALFTSYITQEETNAGAQLAQWNNVLPITAVGQRYVLNEAEGFKLVQVTLGVAQNYSFFGLFTLVP